MEKKFRVRAFNKMQTPDWGWDVFIRIDGRKYICTDSWEFDQGMSTHFSEHKDMKIMQYIWTKDKNDKDIYEWDIVKTPNWIGVVVWRAYKDMWCEFMYDWLLYWIDFPDDELGVYPPKDTEIIGNIYENLDLIPKGL